MSNWQHDRVSTTYGRTNGRERVKRTMRNWSVQQWTQMANFKATAGAHLYFLTEFMFNEKKCDDSKIK